MFFCYYLPLIKFNPPAQQLKTRTPISYFTFSVCSLRDLYERIQRNVVVFYIPSHVWTFNGYITTYTVIHIHRYIHQSVYIRKIVLAVAGICKNESKNQNQFRRSTMTITAVCWRRRSSLLPQEKKLLAILSISIFQIAECVLCSICMAQSFAPHLEISDLRF